MIFIDNLYHINVTEDARRELEEIQYYISHILREPNIARKLIGKIQREIEDLEYMPKKYKIIFKTKVKELHQKAVKNYNIIYRVNSKDQKVYILHIFYSKRNYLKFK